MVPGEMVEIRISMALPASSPKAVAVGRVTVLVQAPQEARVVVGSMAPLAPLPRSRRSLATLARTALAMLEDMGQVARITPAVAAGPVGLARMEPLTSVVMVESGNPPLSSPHPPSPHLNPHSTQSHPAPTSLPLRTTGPVSPLAGSCFPSPVRLFTMRAAVEVDLTMGMAAGVQGWVALEAAVQLGCP